MILCTEQDFIIQDVKIVMTHGSGLLSQDSGILYDTLTIQSWLMTYEPGAGPGPINIQIQNNS